MHHNSYPGYQLVSYLETSIQRLTEDVFEMVKINSTDIVTAHSDVSEKFVKGMVFCPTPLKKSEVETPLMRNRDYDPVKHTELCNSIKRFI